MGQIIIINPKDNVGVVTSDIGEGESLFDHGDIEIKAVTDIPKNHKVAILDIKKGDKIIKYGEAIGIASSSIQKGEWIHTHNLMPEED